MRILLRIWAIFVVVTKRILSQRGLVLAAIAGMTAAVALVMSVPLYADAVYYRTFRTNLSATVSEASAPARPPFPLIFQYSGGVSGQLQWEDIQPVDAYLTRSAASTLGLPQNLLVRYFRTEPFRLFPQGESEFVQLKSALFWAQFAFISGLEEHITILEGRFPTVAAPSADSTVEVLVSESLALEAGLQVGETYIVYVADELETGETITLQIPVRISGVWRPTDRQESYWYTSPSNFDSFLFVPEATFSSRISVHLPDEIYSGVWYLVMDADNIHSSDAVPLLRRISTLNRRVATLLPEIRLARSPVGALVEYQRAARLLTILLYAFSVPIVGLILAFISLVAGLSVERQRNEIAVLRSRGGTMPQIMGIVTLESLLLGAVALAISWPVGTQIARTIGQTRSFLNFTAQSQLRVNLSIAVLRFGIVAIVLGIVTQVKPAIGAARHTIVTYKQERARMLQRPWWQRFWLDVLLLIPVTYGAFLLRQQGRIVVLETDLSSSPFQNPLLFVVPALGVFALTLFFLRLMPTIMKGIVWVASYTKSVGLLLAARHLSRMPGFYTTPMILLVVTLSLSAFTASLAETLDSHLYDQIYYQIGADMNFMDVGEYKPADSFLRATSAVDPEEESGPRWLFFPVSEYLKVPGVEAAARVGRYAVSAQIGSGGTQDGTFIGIDRIDFPRVAFWRRDFAPAHLGTLMNALGVAWDGVLVPRDFMRQNSLLVGDAIQLTVTTYGQRNEMDFQIVGSFDLFPTWYPTDGPLFVGDLEYLFAQAGMQFPYRVWLATNPAADPRQLGREGIRELNVRIFEWEAPRLDISTAQQLPERQGLFGVLSIGFAAAAVMTVLGFLLYALYSFRRRFIELGVLRASGLSTGQMTSFLAWELIFLILFGAGLGTGLGAWVSSLFIPYLQIGEEASARIPPFVVQIAWPAILRMYGLFGLLFIVTLGVLVVLLRRMRIFQAIKLGETT
jgi:putative ABC transport system permease protein